MSQVDRVQRVMMFVLAFFCVISLYKHGNNPLTEKLRQFAAWPIGAETTQKNDMASKTLPGEDSRSLPLAQQLGVTAKQVRIVRRLIDPYQKMVTVNKGSDEGATVGAPLVSDAELIGVVVSTSKTMSEVRLVSDPGFRLGVLVEGESGRAILKGGGSSVQVDRVPAGVGRVGQPVTTYGNDTMGIAGITVGNLGVELNQGDQLVLKRYLLERTVREEYISLAYILVGGAK